MKCQNPSCDVLTHSNRAFCWSCFKALTNRLRRNLTYTYHRIPEKYEAYLAESVEHLTHQAKGGVHEVQMGSLLHKGRRWPTKLSLASIREQRQDSGGLKRSVSTPHRLR
jgi:hypothetical protein